MAKRSGFEYLKGKVVLAAAVLLLLLVAAPAARADCPIAPSGSRPEGARFYNTDLKVVQYCDGVNWIAMHGPGNGSGGCAVAPAGSRPEGAILYNEDHRVLQACAGNIWRAMGPVGGTGTASCSSIGAWTPQTAAEASSWYSLTYGSGLFVAVAVSGAGNRVMTSPDGITWTPHAAAEQNGWYSVTYGNGLFVAVAASGTNRVMTSPDGVTWTPRAAATANSWKSVTYGNGIFVAVSENGTNRVMTSPDGITWTSRTAAEETNNWQSVTYGNGLFVAVSATGTDRVMTSPDGITWTLRTASLSSNWQSVTYGSGVFVAVSQLGTNRVMTSPDGITWTPRTAAEANQWYSVTYGNGLFVAVAADGTNRVMTSPDGVTWTPHAAAEANAWHSVTYGSGRFVAVANDGTNRVMTADCAGATCTNPDRPGGALLYNHDYRVFQYCDGANWVPIGKAVPTLRDDAPDPFGFTDQTDVALSTLTESNIVQITGFDVDAPVSISGDGSPQYRICTDGSSDANCDGSIVQDWTSGAVTIDDGEYLQLRLTSNAANSTMNSATVTVGTESDQWDVTTDDDTTPDALSFTDQTDVALSTLITSNSVNITGITGNVSVSVSGDGSPQIRINGGSWTTSGTIQNGQSLEVRLTSNAAYSTMNSATVTVGTGSDQWDVTTEDDPACPGTPGVGDEGCISPDGSVYAGLSPDGNVPMYTTPADAGNYTWNNGTSNWIDTAMVNCTSGAENSCDTGQGNTALLVGLSDAASPYAAAVYCDGLSAHGKTDWYLPAWNELDVLYDNRTAIGGFNTSGSEPAGRYWSSSEISSSHAMLQRFDTGSDVWRFKNEGPYPVRCVRKDADLTPDAFAFTDRILQPRSTLIESNVLQISGITGDVDVSISGDGSPQFRICSNGSCGSVIVNWTSSPAIIQNNQIIQLRLTTTAAFGAMSSATVAVGTGSDQWDLTTADACPGTPGSGDEGCEMPDGTYYAGLSPDGDVPMYVSGLPHEVSRTWNNGTSNWIDTAMVNCTGGGQTSCNTGQDNTALLVGLSDAGAPYEAAQYCDGLDAHGHQDWYLPASSEIWLLVNGSNFIAGVTTNSPYWPSSEKDNSSALAMYFSIPGMVPRSKNNSSLVRCVRKMPPPPLCSESFVIGCIAADGTVYAGNTPDGDVPMYAARCDQGMNWDGAECAGTRERIEWGSYGIVRGTSSKTTGQANTTVLAGYGQSAHPAAYACAALGPNWYLPAEDELNILYLNKDAGAFLGTYDTSGSSTTGRYFSSTEGALADTTARHQWFDNGNQLNRTKNYGQSVRCVRR